jgi:hypothetical protein
MMNLPEHKASLSITHNQHKDYYQTVDEYINNELDPYEHYDFENKEQREKCVRTNEIWEMQWYPNTPVGFNSIAAPTLEELLDYASRWNEIMVSELQQTKLIQKN